jgi:hypothetical protein
MCADDLEAVVDSLGGDIVIAGPSEGSRAVARGAEQGGQPRVVGFGAAGEPGVAVRDAAVALIAADGSSRPPDSLLRASDDAGFVIAVLNAHEDGGVEPSLLETARRSVDVTLLACREQPTAVSRFEEGANAGAGGHRTGPDVAVGGALDFARMVHRPGQINLDLADAQTVFTDGGLAVLCGGTASFGADGPQRATRRAFATVPSSVDVTEGAGALVSVAGGPEMSIDDAIAAVRTVRGELGVIGDLVWGVTIEEALVGQLTVDIVVDGVSYRPPLSAGDPCRRCGATLTAYNLGDRATLACEACGFADLSASLGERAGNDGGL